MTHTPPDARPPRSAAEYRWNPRKAEAFIDALARHGRVAAAARSVGMTRQSAYKLRARVPQVAEVWARAQAIGRARRRGELPKATHAGASASPKASHAGAPAWPQGDASARQGDTFGAAR
jgi:hypothetical protein